MFNLKFLQIHIYFFAYLLVLHVHLAKGGVVEAKEGRVVGRDDAILRATYTHTINQSIVVIYDHPRFEMMRKNPKPSTDQGHGARQGEKVVLPLVRRRAEGLVVQDLQG